MHASTADAQITVHCTLIWLNASLSHTCRALESHFALCWRIWELDERKASVWLIFTTEKYAFWRQKYPGFRFRYFVNRDKESCLMYDKSELLLLPWRVISTLQPLTTAEKEELSQLRREVKVLRTEREILKRAATFFAKENA